MFSLNHLSGSKRVYGHRWCMDRRKIAGYSQGFFDIHKLKLQVFAGKIAVAILSGRGNPFS